MENGGNDKYWGGQTSNNNNDNNNNVWWDLAHLGLGEEEEEMAGTSRPYDDVAVVLMNSHDDDHHQYHHHQVVVEEEEEEEEVMMMMSPTTPIISSNGGGDGAKAKQQQLQLHYLSSSSSSSCNSLYSSGSSHVYPDPHLTCLKLGNSNYNNNHNKRRQYYFEDGIISTTTTTTTALWKKGKCYSAGGGVPLVNVGFGGSSSTVVIPRCQVDGCNVELLCAREYHRRHKVCEVHSKATKVELLGIEQRFCQQCSRFHVMTEFDDSKRSCRRRLAGHNERRRKISSNSSSSSSNDSTTITSTTRKCFDKGGAGGLPHTKTPSPPKVSNALSLLSTLEVSPAADLVRGKYRTAVQLQDLFADNRANIVASQLFLNQRISKNIKPKMLPSCNKKEKGDHELGGGSSSQLGRVAHPLQKCPITINNNSFPAVTELIDSRPDLQKPNS